MNHRNKSRKLGRNSAHRKALFRNLSISLILHNRIKTTLPKSKELKPFIEKLLTLSKIDNLANRRHAYSIIGNNHGAINKLFKIIGPAIKERNGGYTRIYKFGYRNGDKASMSLIEFVDKDKFIENSSSSVKTKLKTDSKKDVANNKIIKDSKIETKQDKSKINN